MVEYKNRYGDVYTFTKQEDGNVLWEGDFKWCRYGWPNDYSEAWKKFQEDYGGLSFEDFKKQVHAYDDEKGEYVFPELVKLVKSDKSRINMVDPSGGPYLTAGQMLSHIIYGDEMNVIVESFEPVETGYLIKTKPHEYDPNDMSHLKERSDE